MDAKGTSVRDIKIICENNVSSVERKVKSALKEGFDFESVMNGVPGNLCVLMIDRRLPHGVEEII